MLNSVVKMILLLCLVFSSRSIFAVYPKTEEDFASLPPYCKARLNYDTKAPQYKQWDKRMGKETFLHVHHYCAALFSLDLARRDYEQRAFLLKTAISNIAYMEKRVPSSSRLLPEILMKKGMVLLMQGRDPEAMTAFLSSIQLNNRYSPSYMAIADYYISKKQYDEAMEITEKGLKHVPKSKGLKRRKDKINSKLEAQGGGSGDVIDNESQQVD